jgi:hypothetical protein
MKKLLLVLFGAVFALAAFPTAVKAGTDMAPPSYAPQTGPSYYAPPPPYAYYPAPYYAGPPPYYYGPPPYAYYPRPYYYGPPRVGVYFPGLFFGFGFHGRR